jgi:hypothetical protein
MTTNLLNFNYELSLLENLWLRHFIDFCLLLSLEDVLFILSVIYIFSFSTINSILRIKSKKNYLKIIYLFKILFDSIFIYLILKSILLINLSYLAGYIGHINDIIGFLIFIVWCVILICIFIFLPFGYIKISNRII